MTQTQSLSQKALKGVLWISALRIIDSLFQFLRTIILARILAPNHFGLFGIALLSMSILETLSQTGFNAALIQKNKDIKPYLDTAWIVHVVRGTLMAAFLFGISPFAASFFEKPSAIPLLQIMGLSMILRGFANIGVVYFKKDLEFQKEFAFQISGTVGSLMVAVTAALILRNAWALLLGFLAGDFIRLIMSYVVHPYRPSASFNFNHFKELFSFGRWILARGILGFINDHGDDVFVGKFLGSLHLGLYQVAYRMSDKLVEEFHIITSQVTFPVYSKLQSEPVRLKQAFLDSLIFSIPFSAFTAGGILALGTEFVHIFLGDKWLPMIPALRVLALVGLVKALAPLIGPLLRSIEKADINVKIALVRLVVMCSSIYPLTQAFGIAGTALAVLIAIVVAVILLYCVVMRTLKLKITTVFMVIIPPLSSSILMVMSASIAKQFIASEDWTIALFILSVISISIMYILAMSIWNKIVPRYGMWEVMKRRFFGP